MLAVYDYLLCSKHCPCSAGKLGLSPSCLRGGGEGEGTQGSSEFFAVVCNPEAAGSQRTTKSKLSPPPPVRVSRTGLTGGVPRNPV